MTSLKILQYNTDNLRHGWDYFKQNIEDADLAVLQRFPRVRRQELMELMSGCRAYMLESCPPGDMCLAIARSKGAPTFTGTESITLPSAQHVIALEDQWQGCTALKTIMSGINIISFLPCFSTNGGEYPLTETDTLADVKFLIHKFKNEPTIIIGDIHLSGSDERVKAILDANGFKSYLNSKPTFRSHDKETFFNLDVFISNVPNINLTNIKVADVENGVGHMAIRYTLEIDK